MKLSDAVPIAEAIKASLAPFCDRCEIAGSVRRKKPEVGDIEIVAIPRTRDLPMWVRTIEQWERIKGSPTGRYTQRRHSSGMKVDIFIVIPDTWGFQLAIRTGSARFSHEVLARGWVKAGYHSEGGLLYRTDGLGPVVVPEERDLFELIGIPWVEPEDRD